MAGLAPEEGDGQHRLRRDPAHLAAGAVDAARDIDRNDRHLGRIEAGDHLARHALDRPRQPGAEQRVDDEAGALDRRRHQYLDRPGPARRRGGGIALQRLARPEQRDPHRPAALGQHPRRDKPVAAIVAGPAQHQQGALWPAPRDGIGHRAPGILHQHDAGDPAGDRQPVGLPHLLWRQQRMPFPGRGQSAHSGQKWGGTPLSQRPAPRAAPSQPHSRARRFWDPGAAILSLSAPRGGEGRGEVGASRRTAAVPAALCGRDARGPVDTHLIPHR